MKRLASGLLCGAAVYLAIVATASACRIIDPVIWPPPERPVPSHGKLLPIQTRLHKAGIEIRENIASVTVSAVFYNPNDQRVEGTYFFPIEPESVVREFSMMVNGREQKAEIMDAAKARQIYEDIVRRMKDPGLLEYVGMRMLKARVYPIEPRAEVMVTLRYTQVARMEDGVYHFRYPLRSARPESGTIDMVAVSAVVKSDKAVKLFYSPTHGIDSLRRGECEVSGGFEEKHGMPERDFDLYWSLDAADLGISLLSHQDNGGGDGYFMLSLTPRVDVGADEIQPKDVIFAFDKSGSMSGVKIRQARDALKYCLNSLGRDDRFAVIAFGTDVDTLTDGLVKADEDAVAVAVKAVDAIDARGGTAIHAALESACGLISPDERPRIVVFLTDGRPTVGTVDIRLILESAKSANAGRARFFVFGVGEDLNTDLLDVLAVENGGVQQYVSGNEDIEMKISGFYAKISDPVFSGIAVSAGGVELRDMYPARIADIFAGGQVLVFGRYRGRGRGTVTVSGMARGRRHAFECSHDFAGGGAWNDFLPPAWAHRKVAFLLEEIRLHGHNRELEDEITMLGRRHGIVTPYTSFLVVEDAAPEIRRQAGAMRSSFERSKYGREGVAQSRVLAEAKAADFADASGVMLGAAPGAFSEMEYKPVARYIREQVRREGDKVFYLDKNGFYIDGELTEAMRREIVEMSKFSEEYFRLLEAHPGIGRYLAANMKMVLVVDGRAYRITE